MLAHRLLQSVRLFLFSLLLVSAASVANTLHFITISDIHLNVHQTTPMQIDPNAPNSKNDMDSQTFQQLSQLVKRHITSNKSQPAPQFILFTGDAVGHFSAIQHRTKQVTVDETAVFKQLQQMFPHTPIINVFGNNDSMQADYGDFSYHGQSEYKVALAAGFKDGFLSSGRRCSSKNSVYPCLSYENTQQGFFAVHLAKNLVLLGLNSVEFAVQHPNDPLALRTQFHFLATALQRSQVSHSQVLIAMHIPVGNSLYDGALFWREAPTQTFLQLVSRYTNNIIGLIVGHTHMDEIRVLEKPSQAIGEYFTAGFSTSHGNSPSIREFTLQTDPEQAWYINNYISDQIHQTAQGLRLSTLYEFKPYAKSTTSAEQTNLSAFSVAQLLHYYTVANPNFPSEPIKAPQYLHIQLMSQAHSN